MYYFYFDASALVKRYTEEIGSDKVDFLFATVPLNRLVCLNFGDAEVFWICVRKRNDRRITPHEFTQAIGHLNREVIADGSDLTTLPIHKLLVWASVNLSKPMQSTALMPLCYAPRWTSQYPFAMWVMNWYSLPPTNAC